MHTTLWQNVLSVISRSIDANRFETWFRPLTLIHGDDPVSISISAPNQYIADFLEQHYKNLIISTAKQFSPEIENLSITIGNKSSLDNEPLVVTSHDNSVPKY